MNKKLNKQFAFIIKVFPELASILGFLYLIRLELLAIYRNNNGLLVYTLDDAYIHLALAEQISKGHYGVNALEVSAPSSSILWPFLLAPFSQNIYTPFIYNLIFSLLSILVFVQIIKKAWGKQIPILGTLFIAASTLIFVFSTFLVGSVFNGMEHALQSLLVLLLIYGVSIEISTGRLKTWFLIVIVLAPLVRYENLAISMIVLVYLAWQRHFKQALLVFFATLLPLLLFTLFLRSQDLLFLPTSIIAKTSWSESSSTIQSLVVQFYKNFQSHFYAFCLVQVFFIVYAVFSKNAKKRTFSLLAFLALLGHYVLGKFGFFHRYELYILVFCFAAIYYFVVTEITGRLQNNQIAIVVTLVVILFSTSLLVGKKYILALYAIPLASNNIYEQQYQMHRFTTQYYKKPVGVNDLGYVSYKNPNYVLDLVGLANIKSLHHNQEKHQKADWMKNMCDTYSVGLVMIYDVWFSTRPKSWVKIGELHLGKSRVSPYQSKVSFYASNANEYQAIKNQLTEFIPTLPQGVAFLWAER